MMIRKAVKTEGDINSIYELLTVAARDNLVLPRSIDELTGVVDSFFVAVEEGKIVGCCAIEIYNEKLAEIRSLVVAEEFQGVGIGQKLVDTCIAQAIESGIYEVLTITDKDSFFEKSGFRKTLNGQWAMFMKLK